MVNFELVFGNSYPTKPRCKKDPCDDTAQKKAALCKAGESCCPMPDKKEQPYTRI